MSNQIDIIPALPQYLEQWEKNPSRIEELFLEMESHPNVSLDTLKLNYAQLFELDLTVLGSLAFPSNNSLFDLKDLLNPNDLQDKVISSFEEDISNDENFGKDKALLLLSFFFNVLLAIQSNVKAVSVYGYTKSICELIAKARDEEDSNALFDAIAIDKTCLNTPTAQKAVYHATITGDNNFFDKLSRAIKGSRPKNQSLNLIK